MERNGANGIQKAFGFVIDFYFNRKTPKKPNFSFINSDIYLCILGRNVICVVANVCLSQTLDSVTMTYIVFVSGFQTENNNFIIVRVWKLLNSALTSYFTLNQCVCKSLHNYPKN